MATSEHIRAVGLTVQACVETLYSDILPVYGVTSTWVFNSIDDDLPAEGDVKAQLNAYEAIAKLPVNLSPALQDVKASTGTPAEGIFYLPSTIFPILFRIEGVVIPGEFGAQAFGTNLHIERVTLFCEETGSGGSDLVVDVQKDGGSLFSALPTIPANSGDDVLLIVSEDDVSDASIDASDVLTASIVSCPDDCQGVLLTIWVTV